jgi:hypothetical protein
MSSTRVVTARCPFEPSSEGPVAPQSCSNRLQHTVIVTVPAVRVMQVPRHQVVGVVGVRDDLVPAVRAVSVRLVVRAAGVRGRAGRWVLPSYDQRALVDVVAVHVVQVAVVEIVGVVAVLDLFVSTARLVRMVMSIVGVVLCHAFVSLRYSASHRPEL